MRVAVFDTHSFDREAFTAANREGRQALDFFETRLDVRTAPLAEGHEAVCAFVNDDLGAPALHRLARGGLRLVALRSAGFNNVDLSAAAALGLPVVRVPEYSPHAVAEHTFALLLSVVRKLPRAIQRVRDANFSLDGLVGLDLFGKTFGVLGTGRIGAQVARIAQGFGCRLLGWDARPNAELAAALGLTYAEPEAIYRAADILSLHVPLTPETRHLVDARALASMKRGIILLNTGRGALVDTRALIEALKAGKVGGAGLDVYEEEEGLFFKDLSTQVLQDDTLARLLTFHNVVVTAHQAFLTREALASIAETTLENLSAFERGEIRNEVRAAEVLREAPASSSSPFLGGL